MKPRCPPMPTKAQISVTLIGVASIIVTGYVAMCKRKIYLGVSKHAVKRNQKEKKG